MCGLVGVAGNLKYKDEKLMKRLLIYDVFRGQDSTGLAALRKNGDLFIAKIASHPIDLFDTKRFSEALSGHASQVFLGHNRYATKGAVNGVNAHPYEFGHIVGAHNGTLIKTSWDALEKELGEKFDVDSMAVIASIAKLGIEKTVSLLEGAWALTWIDRQDGTINFIRNKERPLWHSFTEKNDKIIWASEYHMIRAAAESEGDYPLFTKHSKNDKGEPVIYRFFQFEQDLWYKFDLEELRAGSDDRPKPKVKHVKGKEPAPVVKYTGSAAHPWTRKTTTPGGTTSSGSPTGDDRAKSDKSTGKDTPVTLLVGTVDAPFAGVMARDDFKDMSKGFCSYCPEPVEFEQPGLTVYLGREIVLCPKCGDNTSSNTRIYVSYDL